MLAPPSKNNRPPNPTTNPPLKNEGSRYWYYFLNFQKKAQSPRIRSFTYLSLSIFTVCFFAIVAIRPTLVTIAKLNREIKDKKEASQKLQTKINAIVSAQKEFSSNNENLYLLDEALPEKNEFPVLAYFLEETATQSGVALTSLSLERIGESKDNTKTSPEKTNFFNFSVGVRGEYPRIKDFLLSLESSRRLIKIQQVAINQSKQEDNPGLLFSIAGIAFFDKK